MTVPFSVFGFTRTKFDYEQLKAIKGDVVAELSRSPAFWGLINPEWSLCNKGRRQSPVNLEPNKLLFDPNLRELHIDKHRVSGNILNTGHSVIFTVHNDTHSHINVSGGPLSYRYQFQEIHIHYGLHDQFGSEHSINGYAFPAELGDLSNPELRILTDQLDKIRYGGDEVEIKRLSVRGLLPQTEYYMTYDGSTTMPACYETVTWLILNKPIYITKQQMHGLRRLMQGDAKHPKAPLGNNFRPPQPLHHRPVRTNIDFNVKQKAAQQNQKVEISTAVYKTETSTCQSMCSFD
ncbi:unnamed protein product [Ceutorhynchus assimilis]|uniref:Alpha-carbonic anhydrase domain-containing protein n=1 Tax=Ceutorhynchus assimilis TaxID=467358 RepID=A0A9N9QAE1_9CUCU|nr:unnamed protein product [Ceutorhynchus assimilis]